MNPDIICIDGGSTDSGPFSLGTATSKYSRAACKSEWRDIMLARQEAGVPLVISSCGTCGADNTVDWMFDITKELAAELNLSVSVARLYSEQQASHVIEKLNNGQCHALEPEIPIDPRVLEDCSHIVALAGAESIQAALQTGADIVLAGRATDTAAICALPLLRGEHAGAAWHGAKVAECGAFCTDNPKSGVILLEVDEDGFTVEPMASDANCTPHSVSAHMLYENVDPHKLYEPGGLLDVTDAKYQQQQNGSVRVTGSKWQPGTYTVKLEAARLSGYQCTLLAVLRNAHYVKNAQKWVDRLSTFLNEEISNSMQLSETEYSLQFRLIGIDAALGTIENKSGSPTEVGVLCIATAKSNEQAIELAKLVNPFLLHYPLTDNEPMPTFAFPHSPAHSERGAQYDFCVNHVIELDDPMDAFRLQVEQVGPHAAG